MHYRLFLGNRFTRTLTMLNRDRSAIVRLHKFWQFPPKTSTKLIDYRAKQLVTTNTISALSQHIITLFKFVDKPNRKITRCNLSAGELEHAFSLSKPKLIFVSPFSADRVVAAARRNRHIVQKVVLFGDENPFVEGQDQRDVVLFEEFQRPVTFVNPLTFYIPTVDIDQQVALIMCSSGTTGLPKGVQLTHANLLASIALLE